MKMKMSKSPGASDLPGLVPHLLQEGVVLHNHRVLNVRALDKKFISIRTLVNILSKLYQCPGPWIIVIVVPCGTFPLLYIFVKYHLWCWLGCYLS